MDDQYTSLFIYFTLDFLTSYPTLVIASSISSIEIFSSSKSSLTLLELKDIFTVSWSTPVKPLIAPSIFSVQDGHVKGSNCIVADLIFILLS